MMWATLRLGEFLAKLLNDHSKHTKKNQTNKGSAAAHNKSTEEQDNVVYIPHQPIHTIVQS